MSQSVTLKISGGNIQGERGNCPSPTTPLPPPPKTKMRPCITVVATAPHPPRLTHSSSNDPPERVPGSAVEPVEERVVTIHGHVVCGTIVEPGGEEKQ